MNRLPYLLILIIWGCLPQVVTAENVATSAIEKAVDAGFSELEREMIGKYFGDQYARKTGDDDDGDGGKTKKKDKNKKSKKGLPPGLAKKDELPPGLAKQLQKNGTLPPGLAKRNLPADLEKRLPPPPKGYERQIIEDATVVLIDKATGKIADIIYDAISGR